MINTINAIKQTRQNNEICELHSQINKQRALIEELFDRVAESKTARKSYIEQERRDQEWIALLTEALDDIRDILKSKMKSDNKIGEIANRLTVLDIDCREVSND